MDTDPGVLVHLVKEAVYLPLYFIPVYFLQTICQGLPFKELAGILNGEDNKRLVAIHLKGDDALEDKDMF